MVNKYGMFERDHRVDGGEVYSVDNAIVIDEMGSNSGGAGAPLRTTSAYTVKSASVVLTGRRDQSIADLFEPK